MRSPTFPLSLDWQYNWQYQRLRRTLSSHLHTLVAPTDYRLWEHAIVCSMELDIGYLRSLENSPRVRNVCVKYLQDSLVLFYPGQT